MMIGSVGSSSSYYQMPQMTGARNAGASPPDPAEMFDKVDLNSSGGLDQDEFQTLAYQISAATGKDVDVEELFETYDEDGDGTLNEEETHAAMEANRPQGPPPGGMQAPPPPPDMSQIVSDADADGDGNLDESELSAITEMINNATGQELDAETLLSTYDEDEDGVLNEEEAMAALEANRPEGPPPPPPNGESQSDAVNEMLQTNLAAASYQNTASSILSGAESQTDSDGSTFPFSAIA